MKRRGFLLSLSTVLFGYGAGCIRRVDYEPVNVQVVNWRNESATVEIEVEKSDGELVYHEEFTLQPEDGGELREDVLEPGSYRFRVTDQDGKEYEYDFSMGDCEWNEVFIWLRTHEARSENFIEIKHSEADCH